MKKYSRWLPAVAVVLAGVLLHFAFRWSGENPLVGLFSAVNESTWEHLKLLFFPYMLLSVIRYIKGRRDKGRFWQGKLVGVLTGMIFIVVAFYTLTGIIGTSYAVVNILLFIVGTVLTFWVDRFVIRSFMVPGNKERSSVVVLTVIALLFVVFTFCPPAIGLFRSPV